MIHPQAFIDPKALIAENVHIGPGTFVGPDVEIGEGTWIGPNAVINGPTRIGKENKIFQFASIGEAPQSIQYRNEPTRLEIGDRNIFRECSTIHRGTAQSLGVTSIGDDNFFMAYAHVAHDCTIGNHVIFANNASISGHVTVEDYACLGGMVGVHQFCSLGAHSFSGGGSMVYKDVPPFVMVSGYPAEAHGLNTVGLERRGYSHETIVALKRAYKVIYRQSLTLQEAINSLSELIIKHPEVKQLTDFLQKKSKRGYIR